MTEEDEIENVNWFSDAILRLTCDAEAEDLFVSKEMSSVLLVFDGTVPHVSASEHYNQIYKNHCLEKGLKLLIIQVVGNTVRTYKTSFCKFF